MPAANVRPSEPPPGEEPEPGRAPTEHEGKTMDKRTTEREAVAELRDGMTIGIGGWGSRRKPMSVVREILRSSVKDLTVVTYGGPDVGLLCNAGKVKKLIYGFVSLDSIALEPHFRKARQAGAIQAAELDEGMLQWGLLAASHKLPFLPTRAGLGSDVLDINPDFKLVQSPYADGEELLAMPAIELDVAFIHMNRGDVRGNGQYLGPDPYFDDMYCRAAKRRFMTVEKIMETSEMANEGPLQSRIINRTMVDGVIEAPNGAHFTECPPDYGRDEAFQKAYAATAKDEDAWLEFKKTYLDLESEAEYQEAVAKR